MRLNVAQMPVKQVFRAWKYLKCHSMLGYCEIWKKRKDAGMDYRQRDIGWVV